MQSSKKRTLLNICIAAGITAVIMLQIAALFDYYFDLNDDVLMKDLLSGSYTGSPEAHNIQMLYPISAMISLLYRLFRHADVYGIFLCGCQFACIFLVLNRSLSFFVDVRKKVLVAVTEVILVFGCLYGHLIYVQYTFTVAMLASAAAFLVITGEGRRNRIYVCLIIWIAFLVRSEMLLLMLPMAGFAWLYRFVKDYDLALADRKKQIKKIYIRWALILFLGLILGKGIDKFAYSNDDWSEFVRLFDARTELYDYQSIPSYEGNEEFYDSIGLDETEVELFFNYNYGLDDEITADTMAEVAAYAKSIKQETSLASRIKQALTLYIYRLHHFELQKEYQYPMTDAPWNLIILVLYVGIIISSLYSIFNADKKEGIKELVFLGLLFIIRSLLWMYILVGERDPIRITHGLMIMEAVVLGGIICKGFIPKKQRIITVNLLVVMLIALCYIPNTVAVAKSEAENRNFYNQKFNELYKYIKADKDNFYWIDLYTSVSYTSEEYTSYSYSEKMFANVDNSFENYDTLGGWVCKSPLQQKKLDKYKLSDIQSSLLQDGVYFVITDESSTDWIVSYYNSKGVEVSLDEVDVVADKFRIIKLTSL